MLAAGMVGLLMGSLLGLRFRVLVLLPFEVAALAAAVVAAATGAASGLTAALGFTLFSVCLQASYVASLMRPARSPALPRADI